jgi:organic radical activating enzyme
MSKYCILPFTSIRIEDDQNKNSTKIRPCCLYRSDMKFSSVEEYLESDALKNLQNHLLTQDTLPNGCRLCKETEEKNQLSVRQLRNKYFNNDIQTKTLIDFVDVFPSNVCNLNCIMCLPKFSSAIGAEQKTLGNISKVYNFDETDFVVDTINKLKDLTSISLAGGEFFYAKHSLKILQAIQQSNITDVKITTNGTVFDDRHVDILSTIKNLELRFSVDGTNSTYEFIRYPADWNQVQSNIKQFQQRLPNAHFETINVLQPLNVFNQFDWITWANQSKLETHWQVVQGDMGWSALTQTEKNQAVEFLISNCKNFDLRSKQKLTILNYARNVILMYEFDPNYRDQFIKKIAQLCRHRKISVETIAKRFEHWPEMAQSVMSLLT